MLTPSFADGLEDGPEGEIRGQIRGRPGRCKSYRKLAALQKWRKDLAAGRRRLELAARYPDLPAQAWSNLGEPGAGLVTGKGARALREWLASLGKLADAALKR
jgi:hypothetical protein